MQPTAKLAPTVDALQPDHSIHAANVNDASLATAPDEDASRYCPVCSHRLESRRCKLICATCGYYMSCADYY